ncbi:MAG TPA: polyprenyl synthetase family protein [Polyangiaceae bacterium]|nr:polyprenyl synthetase family protein [Polyangiaceae bacterium]
MSTSDSALPGPGAARGPAAGEAGEAFAALGARVRAAVEARLGALFEARRREAGRYGGDVSALLDAVRELTMRGGKRLRPALLVASYRACGGGPGEGEDVAIGLGVALELLQTYLLVHDDWMDGDAVRRGGPSVHVMLGAHFGSQAKGNAAAILAGDYANALALEVAAGALGASARACEALVYFARVQQDVVFGQQLDIVGRGEDVELMHGLKTGSYTVRGPLELGAICAGATASRRQALGAYGGPLGVAFQLRDDLLGVFGSERETGKPRGGDLRAGKHTSVVAEALGRLGPGERAAFERAFGRAGAGEGEVEAAIEALERCGARRAVEGRLETLVAEACRALRSDALDGEGARLLEGAALALTARQS